MYKWWNIHLINIQWASVSSRREINLLLFILNLLLLVKNESYQLSSIILKL